MWKHFLPFAIQAMSIGELMFKIINERYMDLDYEVCE